MFETTTTSSTTDAGGIDTVQSTVSFSLDTSAGVRFVERLTLTGTANINGTGNALANILTGNSGNNTLNGGSGSDTLLGGTGNDSYITDGGDTITESAGQGTDTVQSSVSFTLGANLENLILTGSGAINGTGNTLANQITGNGSNNTLNGAGGNDILIGNAGNDTFITDGGDSITEDSGQGTDTVQSSVSFTLGANLENLVFTGGGAINGTGNTQANQISGNSGNNTLNGSTGNDTLSGGNGSDNFIFNTTLGTNNVDRITDFNVTADTIRLENAVFTGLANGTLSAAAFVRTHLGTPQMQVTGSSTSQTQAGSTLTETEQVLQRRFISRPSGQISLSLMLTSSSSDPIKVCARQNCVRSGRERERT